MTMSCLIVSCLRDKTYSDKAVDRSTAFGLSTEYHAMWPTPCEVQKTTGLQYFAKLQTVTKPDLPSQPLERGRGMAEEASLCRTPVKLLAFSFSSE